MERAQERTFHRKCRKLHTRVLDRPCGHVKSKNLVCCPVFPAQEQPSLPPDPLNRCASSGHTKRTGQNCEFSDLEILE